MYNLWRNNEFTVCLFLWKHEWLLLIHVYSSFSCRAESKINWMGNQWGIKIYWHLEWLKYNQGIKQRHFALFVMIP